MIDEIINQIVKFCDEAEVDVPTSLLNFLVRLPLGESGGAIYQILKLKQTK
jgi:hypothetical protein